MLPGKVVVSTLLAAFHFLQFKVQVRQLQLTRRLHPARAKRAEVEEGTKRWQKQLQKGLKSNWQASYLNCSCCPALALSHIWIFQINWHFLANLCINSFSSVCKVFWQNKLDVFIAACSFLFFQGVSRQKKTLKKLLNLREDSYVTCEGGWG